MKFHVPDLFKHKMLKREAQKITGMIALAYPYVLSEHPDAEDVEINRRIYCQETGCDDSSIEEDIAVCLETVNGLSYLLGLQFARVTQGAKNIVVLEFTRYLDKELESLGFARQSLEQKEEILKALKLDIATWKKWDESMK